MFCIKCGKEIPDGAKFCPSCGQAVQGNVEEKVEKKTFKLGKMPPILKKILIAIAVIAVINVSVILIGEYWTFAEIPNPEQFFGLEGEDIGGGEYYDKGWQFESEWDPWSAIEKYVDYLDKNIDDLFIYQDNPHEGKIRIQIMYNGYWLFSDSPSLEIDYYGRNYYGQNSKNQNNVFRIYIDNNFKFVDSECYAGDVSVDDVISDNSSDNSQTESEKESEKVEVNPFALPDPCLFFNCGRHEDQKHDNGDAWLVSCKFDLDEGKNVVQEYIDLLESKYPLGRFDYVEEDYVKYTGAYFYNYYYRYTGTDINIPGFERDGRQNTDVHVSLYYNYRSGFILVTFIYDNTFKLVDCGEKASAIPTSYSGTPLNTDTPQVDFYVPEYAKQDCLMCDGTGDCQKCNGYGTVEYYNGDGEYVTSGCPTCYGNRKCRYCNGTGKRD